MSAWICFAIGCGGAAAFELIRLYELAATIPARRLQSIIYSRLNIVVTIGLIVASGFISWAVNANSDPTAWQIVVTGIGARTLVAKPIELRSISTQPKLGDRSEDNFVLMKDLFP